MTSTELARDHAARRAVDDDLDRTLFLEAGAGSGKTSCLVDRFVALVESGVPADHIAAITFTEKAAGELVDRIRGELERRAREGSVSCADALAVLDRAAIGTLHSFAQRILTEHPIEAGLPPRVTVIDEIASQVAFEDRWERVRRRAARRPRDGTAAAAPARQRRQAPTPPRRRRRIRCELGSRRRPRRPTAAGDSTSRRVGRAHQARGGDRARGALHIVDRQAARPS